MSHITSSELEFLKIYPNLPKFLIDDVTPEEGLIFGQWDTFFWTQRSILYKNTSTCFMFKMKFTYFYPSFCGHYTLKIWLKFGFGTPWRHRAQHPPPYQNLRFWRVLKTANFERPELSQKLIFFDAFFFVRSTMSSSFPWDNKKWG